MKKRRCMAKKVAIIGASADRSKFGNKAVRAYKEEGFEVYPVNPHEQEIEGLKCYKSILDIPGPVQIISLYLHEKALLEILSEIKQKEEVEIVYFNPGTEFTSAIQKAQELDLPYKQQCSIIAIGRNPEEFS